MNKEPLVLISINEAFEGRIDPGWLEEVASGVLQAEDAGCAELGIVVTDDETIRALNREYAGDDHATDVLSFSLEEGEEFAVAPDEVRRIGEVIISYETAVRQAAEQGHTVRDEIEHLLVHGVLHLLGYDHLEPEDERKMRHREEDLLGQQ